MTAVSGSRTALVALAWNYSGAAANTAVQLGYTAYTARTVLSSAYGAHATSLAVLQVLTLFSNAGLTTCLLRSERIDRALLRAAWRICAVSGTLSCLAVQATAPLCASLWHLPLMEPLLRILGLQFLVLPAAAVATAALRRCGLARASVAADLGGQVAGLTTGALLLALGWNPFGMAAAFPVASTCTLLIGVARLARCGLTKGERVSARSLIGLSGTFTGYGVLQTTAIQAPLWMTARMLGSAAAGQFARANVVVGIPLNLLCQSLHNATTPVLAEAHGRGLPLGPRVRDTLIAASALAFVPLGVVAGVGPAALAVLLGPGWESASALVPLLALNAAFYFLCSIGYAVDEVRRAFRGLLVVQASVMAVVLLAVGAATTAGRLGWVPAAMTIGPALGHVLQLAAWRRAGLVEVLVVLRAHLVHAAIGGSLFVAGQVGACYGQGPVGATLWGLLAMVPVLGCWLALRRNVPVFTTAVAHGLIPWPAGRAAGRVPAASE
ncbi:oligosaccharide flippase family protein [Streptacidiphilus rugosus]|uniref:oligosaccharide flippase family protein n=1 Tax=Streptacidiphilus rugosus TaxID=405783 RepID=UPI00056260A1|nr:oligosaccharide flippase family protein [Streptacidiphilus rugosus]